MTGILLILCQVVAGLGAAMLPPVAVAWANADWRAAKSFGVTAAVCWFAAAGIFLALRGRARPLRRGAGLVVILCLWLVPLPLAAVPIAFAADAGAVASLFEAASAWTTTGATAFSSVLDAGRAVVFWRAELQWFGGFVTLTTLLTVLAPDGLGGLPYRNVGLLGPAGEGARSYGMAGSVAVSYGIVSAICFAGLVLTGIPAFDALCIAFATVSTGGLLPIDGSFGAYGNAPAAGLVTIFMVIGGTSVVWHRMVTGRRWSLLAEHRESYWIVAAIVLLGVAYAVAFASLGKGRGILADTADGLFTAASLVTTTGFELRPGSFAALPPTLVILVAIVGGGALSTAGGLKFYRLGAMFTQAGHELKRLVYPHSVRHTRFGSQPYDLGLMKAIAANLGASILVIAVAALLVSMNHPSLEGSLLAAVSAFSNVGPLYASGWAGDAGWPAYAEFGAFGQCSLVAAMVLGRLEVIAAISLLARVYWRS